MSNVLITGTSSGFGFLDAKSLLNQGHTVFATMREPETRNAEAAAALRDAAASSKGTLHVLELDVTDDRSVEQAVKQAIELAGHLDVLVNNAGILSGSYAEAFTIEQFRAVFEVNLFGVHRMCRAVLPHMRERKQGLIINMSSSLGRFVLPYAGPSTATKFGLEAYSQTLMMELAPTGVEVAVVEPGAFLTGVFQHMIFAGDQARLASYGEFADAPTKMFEGFGQMLAAGGPDPQMVANKIVELVGMAPGTRPQRSVIDVMWGHHTESINTASAQAQAGIYADMQRGG
jgi:NAD(P)-dependent dehydrogenase (short-subunit alcohol dehydrogenase family)